MCTCTDVIYPSSYTICTCTDLYLSSYLYPPYPDLYLYCCDIPVILPYPPPPTPICTCTEMSPSSYPILLLPRSVPVEKYRRHLTLSFAYPDLYLYRNIAVILPYPPLIMLNRVPVAVPYPDLCSHTEQHTRNSTLLYRTPTHPDEQHTRSCTLSIPHPDLCSHTEQHTRNFIYPHIDEQHTPKLTLSTIPTPVSNIPVTLPYPPPPRPL